MNKAWQRLTETARLMVGVGDYARYCEHMQARHPEEKIMSEAEFFRYCQERRYPGRAGDIRRCPC